MPTEAAIHTKVDEVITAHKTTPINYYPYVTGTKDIYKQRTVTFGTAVTLVGRAIHRPTKEIITAIGDGETYEIGFLFSRLEMRRKFPSGTEGKWINKYGQIEWWNNRFKLDRVVPTGQVGLYFSMMVALGNSIPGQRDS